MSLNQENERPERTGRIYWRKFKDGHPQLGMKIEVKGADGKPVYMGKIEALQDLGGGWTSMTSECFVNAAARADYEWREWSADVVVCEPPDV